MGSGYERRCTRQLATSWELVRPDKAVAIVPATPLSALQVQGLGFGSPLSPLTHESFDWAHRSWQSLSAEAIGAGRVTPR